jgi:exosortase A-associated hydrolase 2
VTAAPDPARPWFLPAGERRLFCLDHRPRAPVRGAVLYVPPWAEEMNKSRRMAALQSRALAAAGWHVLQLDLTGTGDSSGDFADATWDIWLQDLDTARGWLAQASGFEPWLWGLRLGALLAAESLVQHPAPGLLCWQPVASGRLHLQQFLRLKAGADWLGTGHTPDDRGKPMDQLEAGEVVEVAGYNLPPALALPMARAEMRLPAELKRVVCFEVAPREAAALSPASERQLAPLRAAGGVHSAVVTGASFWQSLEIETVPALIDATCAAMAS